MQRHGARHAPPESLYGLQQWKQNLQPHRHSILSHCSSFSLQTPFPHLGHARTDPRAAPSGTDASGSGAAADKDDAADEDKDDVVNEKVEAVTAAAVADAAAVTAADTAPCGSILRLLIRSRSVSFSSSLSVPYSSTGLSAAPLEADDDVACGGTGGAGEAAAAAAAAAA